MMIPMFLVICDANDTPALWAYQGLKSRGLNPIWLLTPEILILNLKIEHHLTTNKVSTVIELADGRCLRSDEVQGVLTRFADVPLGHLLRADVKDQLYAHEELFALFLSWMYALPCRVVNSPKPFGLSGRWRREAEWAWLALKAGLPMQVYQQSSTDLLSEHSGESRIVPPNTTLRTVIIMGESVYGSEAPHAIQSGCRVLGRLAAVDLLGVQFMNGASGLWTFAGVTLMPDLREGGNEFLDGLAGWLRQAKEKVP
jgi:hypothetical protein